MTRVVVTGMGAVTPIGNSLPEFWESIQAGKSGIDLISKFDATEFKAKVAAEVKDFDPETVIKRRDARRMELFTQYAVVAADEAIKDAGYEITEDNARRVGIILASGVGGMPTIEEGQQRLAEKGPKRINPFFIPMVISNMSAGNVSIHTGARGASMTVNTACAGGTNAVGEGFLKIKSGLMDACIVGGSESAITPLTIGSFDALTALSTNPDPKTASRPFDEGRDGFVSGEGAGVLFIESLESAQARGAKIYAEIVGYGANSDAYHMTSPREDGSGAAESMQEAIDMAGIDKDQIGYINAHGTSTPTNDVAETLSIKRLFGERAYEIPVSSVKGHIGHLLGAAGGIEAVLLAKALEEGYIPMTLGLENPAEDCDLDYVPHEGRHVDFEYGLSNSLGFGGHNATILMKRWDGK